MRRALVALLLVLFVAAPTLEAAACPVDTGAGLMSTAAHLDDAGQSDDGDVDQDLCAGGCHCSHIMAAPVQYDAVAKPVALKRVAVWLAPSDPEIRAPGSPDRPPRV